MYSNSKLSFQVYLTLFKGTACQDGTVRSHGLSSKLWWF